MQLRSRRALRGAWDSLPSGLPAPGGCETVKCEPCRAASVAKQTTRPTATLLQPEPALPKSRQSGRNCSPGCSALGSFTYEETQGSIISPRQPPPSDRSNTFAQALSTHSWLCEPPVSGCWQKKLSMPEGPAAGERPSFLLYKPPPLKDILEIPATREGKHLQLPLTLKAYLQSEAHLVGNEVHCRSSKCSFPPAGDRPNPSREGAADRG